MQVCFSGTTTQLATGSNSAMGAFGNRIDNPTWYRSLVPIAGTAGQLRIKLDVMPGVGKSYQFNFQLNGVTQFSVTISGTATTGFSASTFACSAGDYLTVVAVPSGPPAPAAAYAYWCWTWEPTTADKTMVCGYTDVGQLPTSGTRYLAFSGADAGPQTLAQYARLYMPIAGTFSNFHVLLSAAPSPGANSRVLTWQKGGVNQALTVTISGTNTTGSDTSNSFAVMAGDFVNLRATSPGRDAQPVACHVSIAAVFTPTIPKHFLVGNGGADILPSGTTTEYGQFASGSVTWDGTANKEFNCTHRVQVVAMRAKVTVLPSSGTWKIQTDTLDKGPSVLFTSTSATELASRRLHNWQDGDLPIMVCGATGVGAPVSTRLSCCLACRAVPVHGTGFPL